MRVTMVAMCAGSLLGLTAPALAGVPLGGLARNSQPAMVAQASVTPGATAGNAAALGATTQSTSLASPAPSAAGAPMTAGAINQSNAGGQSLPSSALPATTEPVPPTPSSIAPPPASNVTSQAPMSGGLGNPFDNFTPNQSSQGSFSVAPVNRQPEVPSTNGGANPNVSGWDHP